MQVLTTNDKDEWKELLFEVGVQDLYYMPEYCELFERNVSGHGVLLYLKDCSGITLMPSFIKQGTLTSTWYYGGPISNCKHDFERELVEFAILNGIEKIFIRMHPLLGNHKLLQSKYNRETVYINLEEHDLWNNSLDRHCRKNINKAKKHLTVEESKNHTEFHRIYTKDMIYKKADNKFMFTENFFKDMFKMFKDNMILLLTRHGEDLVGGTLALGNGDYVYDYLRGYDNAYQQYRPNNLMVWETILKAKSMGFKGMSLIGGTTTTPTDPILKFKKSFSNETKMFYVYNWENAE